MRLVNPALAATIVVVVSIGVVGGHAIRAAGLSPYQVKSGSMEHAIDTGDWAVVSGVDPADVQRGDIVLFRYPFGTTGRAVKRVLAVAGDTVAFTDTTVTVNGRRRSIAGTPLEGTAARQRPRRVPAGHVFLLGDNTAASYDSRGFGPVADDQVVGRVRFTIPHDATVIFPGLIACCALGAALMRLRPARNSPNVQGSPGGCLR